jgi:ribulose-5-phosphate 4-epimerase/fuculose-1-phosphate aldolase
MRDVHEAEGVIKFSADHAEGPLPAARFAVLAAKLAAWRELLRGLGLVGQDDARYEGAGFGNVSGRCGPFPGGRGRRPFLITGTQTGGRRCVSLEDFCVVESWDAQRNRVRSRGPLLPSSESLTHGAIYDLGPQIRFVLHAHAPVLWSAARSLRLPMSAPDVAYGTPAMAEEVQRLWRESTLGDLGVFAMGGHEDGVIAFGRTPDEAGAALLRPLARAYEDLLLREGELCRMG